MLIECVAPERSDGDVGQADAADDGNGPDKAIRPPSRLPPERRHRQTAAGTTALRHLALSLKVGFVDQAMLAD